MESGDNLQNGLRVSVDYLAFTTTDCKDPYVVAYKLGFDIDRFTALEHGGLGYKSAIKLRDFPVTIFFDGNEDMGIHVVISGSAINESMSAYKQSILKTDVSPFGLVYDKPFDSSFLASWLLMIQGFAKFSRIDLAIDDIGSRFFTLDALEDILRSGRFVSKFHKKQFILDTSNDADCTKIGHTIYMGKRVSACFLRVYDKMLEQKYVHSVDTSTPWVRWELELKEDYASRAVQQLVNQDNLGSVCIGILANYLRLIEKDNANKSRCSVNPVWQAFIDAVAPLSLYVAPPPKPIEKNKDWIMKQCSRTLAKVVVAEDGDSEFLDRVLDYGRSKLKPCDYDSIEQYQKKHYGDIET